MKKLQPHKLDREAVRRQFQDRHRLLEECARRLEAATCEILHGIPRIDRVYFRAKSVNSFVDKACHIDPATSIQKYASPFDEIEDQVAGRILVFLLSDIDIVSKVLLSQFGRVEAKRKQPTDPNRFDYESQHFVFTIPLEVQTDEWALIVDMPRTFEMQVRTLFMHAWAEPQHDLEYKAAQPLTTQDRRLLASAAASAWGADQALEMVHERVNGRRPSDDKDAESTGLSSIRRENAEL